MSEFTDLFTSQLGIEIPLICGPMYPCSNPELVAAVSESGGIGVIQPVSMVFVHKHDFREGLRYIRTLTDKPIGLNVLVEKTLKAYREQMKKWVEIAIEEGVKFFVTALGDPEWVVKRVHENGCLVYHDVSERKFAMKAMDKGVDGLICVNNRAGGHTGNKSAELLREEFKDLGVPLICAGGISTSQDFITALSLGYAGVQMGTRFIATEECKVHKDYKDGVVQASEDDIVHTDKISGLNCSVINTPTVEKLGRKSNTITRWLLRHPRTKPLIRTIYTLRFIRNIKRASLEGINFKDVWQAGKSAAGVSSIESASTIVRRFGTAYRNKSKQ